MEIKNFWELSTICAPLVKCQAFVKTAHRSICNNVVPKLGTALRERWPTNQHPSWVPVQTATISSQYSGQCDLGVTPGHSCQGPIQNCSSLSQELWLWIMFWSNLIFLQISFHIMPEKGRRIWCSSGCMNSSTAGEKADGEQLSREQ